MRILHLIDSLGVGGAENQLLNFIKQYKTNYKDDLHYVVTLNRNNHLLREVIPFINEYACLNFKRLTFWKSVRYLKRLLKTWEVDVIHSHLFYSTIVARLASSSY